jgi:sigma-E factor negative regulatory protein RseC
MMLEEEGLVKEVVGGKALVATERREECAHCVARKACHMVDDGKELLAHVLNPVGAGVGDRVKITIKEGVLLKNSLILYFIPVLGLIVGSVLGYYLGRFYGWNLDLSAMLSGLSGLGLSFLIIFILNVHLKETRAYWPQIQKVITKGRPDNLDHESIPEHEARREQI